MSEGRLLDEQEQWLDEVRAGRSGLISRLVVGGVVAVPDRQTRLPGCMLPYYHTYHPRTIAKWKANLLCKAVYGGCGN